MRSAPGTRAALALIFVLAIGARLGYYALIPHPMTGPWLMGAMAHNIIDDGHWFQINENAGPHFSMHEPNEPSDHANAYAVAPAQVNLKYADAHPRWVPYVAEPVGEVVLLAGLWELTGSQTYPPDVFIKIILDALAALLVYHIAMRLLKRRRTALVASLLYALYPPIAAIIVSPDRTVWSLDFTIAILAVYLQALTSTHPRRWLLACGILTGIASYFDSGVLIIPGALALAGVSVAGWRTTLRRALIPTAIAVLLIVPWSIRNYNDFHRFIPLRTGVGQNIWVNLIKYSRFVSSDSESANIRYLLHVRPNLHWETPAFDSYLGSRGLAVIEHHPLYYLEVTALGIWRSTLGDLDGEWMPSGTTTPFAYPRGPIAYVYEQPFQLLLVALMPLVFLLAMLSLGFTWARYKPEHLLLIAVALSNAVPYLILKVEPRYLLPAAISYFIWIGLGSDLLLERLSVWRAERRGGTAYGALAK